MELVEVKQKVAEKIKARLNELGIKNKQFAGMMNVQPSTITKWLSGTHNFTIKTIMDIELALNVNILNYS
jgi:transcriptional regulator with XRE-family HTH domain